MIGAAGAMSKSGYVASVVTLVCVALLTKSSLDSLIHLQEKHGTDGFENLGLLAFGRRGKYAVLLSKFLYSFGCTIAYMLIVKNNLSSALCHLLAIESTSTSTLLSTRFLLNKDAVSIAVSAVGILPVCLHRRFASLAKFSLVSIVSIVCYVSIVVWEYYFNSAVSVKKDLSVDLVLPFKASFFSSMGTFVFAFVSQHCAHMAYRSMRVPTSENWRKVTAFSTVFALTTILVVSSYVYFTFWDNTPDDIFSQYPPSYTIDYAKLLLSLTMLLSFPLPFFTCRELIIVWLLMLEEEPSSASNAAAATTKRKTSKQTSESYSKPTEYGTEDDLHARLLSHDGGASLASALGSSIGSDDHLSQQQQQQQQQQHRAASPAPPYYPSAYDRATTSSASSPSFNNKRQSSRQSSESAKASSKKTHSIDRLLLPATRESSSPNNQLLSFQLRSPYHQGLTLLVWGASVTVAALSPSLGSVLDLVGNVAGSAIAFILPAAFFIKLENRLTVMTGLMFSVGCFIGLIGTIFSIKNIVDGNEDGNCCS